jgi:hypothetical protein
MLSTTRDPENESEMMSERSVPVRVYGGALSPTAGRSPTVWTAFPPRLVVAMNIV